MTASRRVLLTPSASTSSVERNVIRRRAASWGPFVMLLCRPCTRWYAAAHQEAVGAAAPPSPTVPGEHGVLEMLAKMISSEVGDERRSSSAAASSCR